MKINIIYYIYAFARNVRSRKIDRKPHFCRFYDIVFFVAFYKNTIKNAALFRRRFIVFSIFVLVFVIVFVVVSFYGYFLLFRVNTLNGLEFELFFRHVGS